MKNWERYAEREIESKMMHIRATVTANWRRFSEEGYCGNIYCDTCPFKDEGCNWNKCMGRRNEAKMLWLNEEVGE